ncbi:MAG: transcription elongation factor/antiterminator RfaH [Gemmatimonadetes bacterium]|nr:transcription elongation factor/antiterminator RfaH [Gemmatimonadota bacterium]
MTEIVETSEDHGSPWFVIWAESRAEKKVEKRIAALGLTPWLPVVRERHRWSDRWRDVERPLFPGYLFARASNADLHQVLRIPGVLTVVKQGGKPALLTDTFVKSLRDAIGRAGVSPEAVDGSVEYSAGDEVIVQEGALRGVRGIVQERRSGRQLVLWVAEIGRGVAFTIGSALVSAARDAGIQLSPNLTEVSK